VRPVQNQHVPVGKIGIWTVTLDFTPTPQAKDHVAELDALGFGALWIPEAVGCEPLTHAAVLLSASDRITLATGIASIWSRDPMGMNAAHRTVNEAFPGRFLLGLGVSHAPMVEGVRGHDYAKPLSAMRTYLDRMDTSLYFAAEASVPPQRVLAALRPKMLALAAERAAGVHPYFVPVEHTAFARETLGDEPLLAVELAVALETDPTRAREIARIHTSTYVGLPNYTNNLKRFGFTDDDLPDNGSDRLVDAIVAWGDIDAIVARVQAHLDAGADHVCIQVLGDNPTAVPMESWRLLADALLD
jgi:probable F420-dependent oxidoreductase